MQNLVILSNTMLSNFLEWRLIRWMNKLPTTSDRWLENNPSAKAKVENGLKQAARGEVVRNSFITKDFEN